MPQPVIIQDAISIAANSVNNNVIASNNALLALRRLPFPAQVEIAFVQAATGLTIDFDVGPSNVVSASNGRVTSQAPVIPLDIINGECYGDQGELLTIKAANTTGAAIVLRYVITARPLAQPGEHVQLPPNNLVCQQGPIAIANGTNDFPLLNGLRLERPPVDSIGDVLMTQSATGLLRTVYIDNERVAPPSTISLANQMPQDPFDSTVTGLECPEDKEIQLNISNNSGGALNIFWKLILRQLVRV
jgi:hypothetical protein